MGKYTKLALTVNVVVFSLIFLLHLFRIISGFEVRFGSLIIPNWISYIALVVALVLIYLNYKGL
ncbi:hypothetical protein HYU23_01355 [Candidatus Woesearchaeota archaeon]|nr:hypothetical protein [Candidatus Woesearchaeota archaeon]